MLGMDRVSLFTMATRIGTWLISTDSSTFQITPHTYGFPYYLTISEYAGYETSSTRDIYALVRAVANHQTGLIDWDDSSEKVSDYIRDWKIAFGDKLRMQVLGDYLQKCKNRSMRDMVDYFEHKHGYMMGRIELGDLLRDLMMTGQVTDIPSMDMAPAEMQELALLAKTWLKSPTDSSE